MSVKQQVATKRLTSIENIFTNALTVTHSDLWRGVPADFMDRRATNLKSAMVDYYRHFVKLHQRMVECDDKSTRQEFMEAINEQMAHMLALFNNALGYALIGAIQGAASNDISELRSGKHKQNITKAQVELDRLALTIMKEYARVVNSDECDSEHRKAIEDIFVKMQKACVTYPVAFGYLRFFDRSEEETTMGIGAKSYHDLYTMWNREFYAEDIDKLIEAFDKDLDIYKDGVPTAEIE